MSLDALIEQHKAKAAKKRFEPPKLEPIPTPTKKVQKPKVWRHGPALKVNARAGHQRYEAMKAEWTAKNPEATPAEYTAEMRRIATLCGV